MQLDTAAPASNAAPTRRRRTRKRHIAKIEKCCVGCGVVIVRIGDHAAPRATWCPRCAAKRERKRLRKRQALRTGRYYDVICKDCGSVVKNVFCSTQRCKPCNTIHKRKLHRGYNSKPTSKAQYLAQQAIYKARRSGHFLRPSYCQHCGKDCKPHAHHFVGYEEENAMKVVWLCPPCHTLDHQRMRRQRRNAS